MELRTRINGVEHWTRKGEVKLFLWQKARLTGEAPKSTIFFVHGSSMASRPTFDLQVPGRPDSSVMDRFAARGYDTWCMDHEGYGRSDKSRPINCDIANGADDLAAGTHHKKLLMYGISSGALRAAAFTERYPERVARLALDAFVWTGKGSPTLAERRKELAEFQSKNRRAIDRSFLRSIFTRDHPGTADDATIEAFASAILALDDSVPTGTYVDMCSKLPLVDPARIAVPTIIMRGEFDGIAGFEDLIEFFTRLPNPDKQFAVMAGISHASFQQKNYLTAYHILHSFFATPEPFTADEPLSVAQCFRAAGMPAEIVQRLNGAIDKARRDPEVQANFRAAGVEATSMGPQELNAFMGTEHAKWGRVVRETGATVN